MTRRKTIDYVEATLGGYQAVRIRMMSDGNLIVDIPTRGQQWRMGGFRSGRDGGTQIQLSRTGEVTGVGNFPLQRTEKLD
ncbi:MAG TPA: hypothetical protein VEX15_18355 [Nocardioidaceae bacterium]|nr:hypothetical protein [Nocardioidaceae bacterium]